MTLMRVLRPAAEAPDHRGVFAEFRRTMGRLLVEQTAAREPRIVKFPRVSAR